MPSCAKSSESLDDVAEGAMSQPFHPFSSESKELEACLCDPGVETTYNSGDTEFEESLSDAEFEVERSPAAAAAGPERRRGFTSWWGCKAGRVAALGAGDAWDELPDVRFALSGVLLCEDAPSRPSTGSVGLLERLAEISKVRGAASGGGGAADLQRQGRSSLGAPSGTAGSARPGGGSTDDRRGSKAPPRKAWDM